MTVPVTSDHNVPLIPGRSWYNIVNTTATWCYHHMAAGVALTGEAPRTALLDEATTDPVCSAGKAEYRQLIKGGLFTIQAKAKRTLVIDAIDNAAGATLTIITSNEGHSRTAPTSVPFKLAAGEVFKAIGGSVGSYVGILYRIDGEEIW